MTQLNILPCREVLQRWLQDLHIAQNGVPLGMLISVGTGIGAASVPVGRGSSGVSVGIGAVVSCERNQRSERAR